MSRRKTGVLLPEGQQWQVRCISTASLPVVAHRKILLRHQLDRSPYYFSKFQQEHLKYLKYFQQTFDLCEREKPEEGGGRCVQAGPDLYVG